jgi:hypothetical protein
MLITIISLTSAIAALGMAYLLYLIYCWLKEIDLHLGIMQHELKKRAKLKKSKSQ